MMKLDLLGTSPRLVSVAAAILALLAATSFAGSLDRAGSDRRRAVPGAPRAATLTVDWQGTGDYTTIQAALNAATNGDTIVVLPSAGSPYGAYQENVLFPAAEITLRSTDPDNPAVVRDTVIDGRAAASTVQFAQGTPAAAVLAGFTIYNGAAEYGGGIYCCLADPTIRNCVLTLNNGYRGGGMYCLIASPTLLNCTFRSNFANYGGGMFNYNESNPRLINCVFSGNDASSFT
jgi:hypothetical protein